MQTNLHSRWVLAVGCLLAFSSPGSADEKTPDKIIQSKLQLVPGTPTYEAWRKPTDNYFEVFLFNWTNPDKFPAEKPHLEELGPYRFRQHLEQVNVTWNETEHTLGYYTFKSYVFDETSSGSLDDVITIADYVVAALVEFARPLSYFIKASNKLLLNNFNRGKSISKTARELLFDGYSDHVLSAMKLLPINDQLENPDKFGWFYQKNNSLDSNGYIEVTTGEEGSVPGKIVRWMQEDHNKYYEGACSKLEGSAGDFFPRDLTEESQLKVFLPDMCRSVAMPYKSSGELNGLKYHKYELSSSSFDKKTNSNCFCKGPCEWGGVMNVSACHLNGPAFISLPHFLHADPRLGEQFTGLNPDPEKHSFYYSVEPRTGLPLDVATRYQMNVYMEDDDNVYDGVPKLLFPVFWVQERRTADQATLQRLVPKSSDAGVAT